MAKNERGSLGSWLHSKLDLSSLADSLTTSAATSRANIRVNSLALAPGTPPTSDTPELQQTDGPSHGVSEAILNPVAPVFSPGKQSRSSSVSPDGPSLRGGAVSVETVTHILPGKRSLLYSA
jgi:hypothetical protein